MKTLLHLVLIAFVAVGLGRLYMHVVFGSLDKIDLYARYGTFIEDRGPLGNFLHVSPTVFTGDASVQRSWVVEHQSQLNFEGNNE